MEMCIRNNNFNEIKINQIIKNFCSDVNSLENLAFNFEK